jgi:Protein of unknown function (DUF3478).
MSFTIVEQNNALAWVKISGRLSITDLLGLQVLAQEMGETYGSAKALIELDNFEGWSHEEGWENTRFLPDQVDSRFCLAIVGDDKWRDDWMMFFAVPLRNTEVKFFPPDHMHVARAWLLLD